MAKRAKGKVLAVGTRELSRAWQVAGYELPPCCFQFCDVSHGHLSVPARVAALAIFQQA